MSETKESRAKALSDELSEKSKTLTDVPHFFWLLDTDTGEYAYFGNLGDGDACQIIETLAKVHGGEVIDRVVDKIIEQDEPNEFPEILH